MNRVEPNQRPTRRMSDIGPRRSMDMRRPARPAGAQQQQLAQPPAQPGQAPSRPAGMRPMQPMPRPQAGYPQQPVRQPQPMPMPARPMPAARPEQPVAAPQRAAAPVAPARPRRRRAWLVVLQFVVGLLVIVGVAAAIVALYLRYYQ